MSRGRLHPVSAKVVLFALFFSASTLRAPADEPALESIGDCRLMPANWADGDSFRVRFPDGREETLRLYGADCIEWHVNDDSDGRRLRTQRRYFGIAYVPTEASILLAKSFGEAAAARTRELLERPFTVHTSFADGRGDPRFSRIYGFVTTGGGDDLASVLVREGLARAFGVYRAAPDGASSQEYRERLKDLELTAASARRGVWAKTDWDRLPAERLAERRDEQDIAASLPKVPPPKGIDPNTASRDELMLLPGVGEVTATKIIKGRSRGPYTSPLDLMRIRGMSATTISAMSSSLRFPEPGENQKPDGNDATAR